MFFILISEVWLLLYDYVRYFQIFLSYHVQSCGWSSNFKTIMFNFLGLICDNMVVIDPEIVSMLVYVRFLKKISPLIMSKVGWSSNFKTTMLDFFQAFW